MFPEGLWRAPITAIRIKELSSDEVPGSFLLKNSHGRSISFQLGGSEGPATALVEGQEDAGQQAIFDEVLLQDGDFSWDDPELSKDAPGRLWFARNKLTNLALALGMTESDGNGATGPTEDFCEALVAGEGELEGQEVAFQVVHDRYTYPAMTKTGQPHPKAGQVKVTPGIVMYSPAV